MDRRNFISLLSNASYAYLGLSLTGCGIDAVGSSVSEDETRAAEGSVKMYDIVMQGFSKIGNSFLGENGVLKATVVRDNKPVTLTYIQDPHGHKFSLTVADFAKLKRGQIVEVITTVALGHDHKVVIDPSKKAPGSQPIDIPLDPDGSGMTVYATVSEDEEHPELFVAGSEDLDESTMQYCLDTTERCDADASLWKAMKRHAPRADQQIFVSDGKLNLDLSKRELPLILRGKAKKDSRLMKLALKLINQR